MKSLVLAVGLLSCAGCMPNVQPATYSVGSVGQVNRSIAGVVISARPVLIDATTGGGAAAGAGIGAVAGSGVGGGSRANAVGAIGGAIVGAIAGAAIEHSGSQHTGTEYVVETETGNLMTVVQAAGVEFLPGTRVIVLYGSPARLIADPRTGG